MTESAATRRRSSPAAWLLVLILSAALLAAVLLLDPAGRLRSAVLGGEQETSSGPAVVEEIRKAAELKAATGTYSVPVFLEKDQESGLSSLIPDVLDGEQIVAVYTATVDATVDLSELPGDSIQQGRDGKITITVPEPVLSSPNIDEEKSRIVAHSRGIVARVSDAVDGSPLEVAEELDQEAVRALEQAAESSELTTTARDNTASFLQALVGALGYDDVEVVFTA